MGHHKKHTKMHVHADQPVAISATMPVPSLKEKTLPNVKKKAVIVVGAALMVAVLAVLLSHWYVISKPKDAVTVINHSQLVEIFDEADELARHGDRSGATTLLMDNREKIVSTEDKAEASRRIAQLYMEDNKLADAMIWAEQANRLQTTAAGYALIGAIAMAQQDWSLAADSYTKAAENSEKTDDPTKITPYNDYKNSQQQAQEHL